MKETPILMCGEMVRQTMAGVKLQTRRVVKWNHLFGGVHPAVAQIVHRGGGWWGFEASDEVKQQYITTFPFGTIRCPYGNPGDRLWVKETWRTRREWDHVKPSALRLGDGCELRENWPWFAEQYVTYAAEDTSAVKLTGKVRPSIFMPRWAARILLEVVRVRVERVQQITPEDVVDEGVTYPVKPSETHPGMCQPIMRISGAYQPGLYLAKGQPYTHEALLIAHYASLWDSLNAKRENGKLAWAKNPWVWVIEFRVLDKAAE